MHFSYCATISKGFFLRKLTIFSPSFGKVVENDGIHHTGYNYITIYVY